MTGRKKPALDINTNTCYNHPQDEMVISSKFYQNVHVSVLFFRQAGAMKKYSPDELVKKWEREELTVEQAIGQLLLWVIALVERVTRLEANAGGRADAPTAARFK